MAEKHVRTRLKEVFNSTKYRLPTKARNLGKAKDFDCAIHRKVSDLINFGTIFITTKLISVTIIIVYLGYRFRSLGNRS